jgi:hypothetical protein
MKEPTASRPYWPDALEKPPDSTKGLKPWSWAVAQLQNSHNYWIATSRPDGRPHLMLVWGVWLEDAFWFTTGSRTRKMKNLLAHPECVVGTEDADEAVIVEGMASFIEDVDARKRIVTIYDKKYGGDIGAVLESSGSLVIRVEPRVIFGFDEHAENFVESATRWTFEKD